MNTITLMNATNTALYCLFCGQQTIPEVHDADATPAPCEHTLFIAHPEGCEYLAPALETALAARGIRYEDGCLLAGKVEEADEDEDDEVDPDDDDATAPDDPLGLLLSAAFPDQVLLIRSADAPQGLEIWLGLAPVFD